MRDVAPKLTIKLASRKLLKKRSEIKGQPAGSIPYCTKAQEYPHQLPLSLLVVRDIFKKITLKKTNTAWSKENPYLREKKLSFGEVQGTKGIKTYQIYKIKYRGN